MTKKLEEKGFAGLSSLVTDVKEGVFPHSKPKSSNTPKTDTRLTSLPPKNSSSVNWWGWGVLVGIACLVFFIFMEYEQEIMRSSGEKQNSTSQSVSQTDITRLRTALSMEINKPPVGTDNTLSVDQIRWCLREELLIESKRSNVTTNREIEKLNQNVSDYNRRCGKFQYYNGAMERAKQDVQKIMSQIVSETQEPSIDFSSPSKSRKDLVTEIQAVLEYLGYKPGAVDGVYGKNTRMAIMAFERDMGKETRGEATNEILWLLKNTRPKRSQ